jgi:hypothetical protein
MRGSVLPAAPSRVRGILALQRRCHGLLRAAHRFARHRARTAEELAWSARAVDALTAAYVALTDGQGSQRRAPERVREAQAFDSSQTDAGGGGERAR